MISNLTRIVKIPVLILSVAFPCGLWAAPVISHLTVADVSPVAVRVVWQTDVASEPDLAVFSNAAGTIPVAGAVIKPFGALADDEAAATAAKTLGVHSVDVTGLQADTLYYLRAKSTARSDGSVTQSALIPVRTAKGLTLASFTEALAPVTNPVLRFDCLSEDASDAGGVLLVARIQGARSALSAFPRGSKTARLNLNNLISDATGNTMRVEGYEPLVLELHRGFGKVEVYRFHTPAGDGSGSEADPFLTGGPLTAPAIRARSGGVGASRVFMEFPVAPGGIYRVEASSTLGGGSWQELVPGILASGNRLFWEDNGTTTSEPSPSGTPRRFYRLAPVE